MRERKRILLVAATTGYQTRMFAEAAERLGVELSLATDRCHVLDDPWGDRAIPVRFEEPEQAAAALAAGAAHGFDGIVAVGDRPAYLAALAAARLGVPYNPPESVLACRNKFLARERFRQAGLPVPDYFLLEFDADLRQAARRAPYPCVLKPLGLSASRGVIRANDEAQFAGAFRRIQALLGTPEIARMQDEADRRVLVESYIEGREFALEGIVTNGRLQVLALFDKPDPLEGPFFEETIYVTPSRESEENQEKMAEAAARAVNALGLSRGPVHAEMRLNGQGVWILEVAARPIGGLCARALRFQPDVPLEEVILRQALGEDVSPLRLRDPASGVMMIPIPKGGIYRGVMGVEQAASVAGIEDVLITAKEGQELAPLPEGNSYLGFLFARGESPAAVEASLRRAHAGITFQILTSLPVTADRSI